MAEITPLDYLFLLLETKESPKHVGSIEIMRPPEGAPEDYVNRFVNKLRQRAPDPPYNYRVKATLPNLLGLLPGLPSTDLAMPQWHAVSSVDMNRHVIHHVLPQPGSLGQLVQTVKELHETLLARDRPLWECHVIEGYEGGERFVVYTKIHHAYTDGVLASMRAVSNTSATPDPDVGKVFWELPEGWDHPGKSGSLLKDTTRMAKGLLTTSTSVGEAYLSVLKSGVGALLKTGSKRRRTLPFMAAATGLDKQPTAGRSLAFSRLSLDRVKALGNATGTSINDILLTVLDVAVRQYLAERGEDPRKPLVALMPMSLRNKGDTTSANCVSIAPAKLGARDASLQERLRSIKASTRSLKEDREELSADASMAYSMVVVGLAQIGESLHLTGSVAPLGNFVFSNVPGPPQARYRFDARIEEIYPVSVLAPGAYLNITSYSYGGQILLQFTALEEAAPDLGDLVDHTLAAFGAMEREMPGRMGDVKKSAKTAAKPAVSKKPAKAAAKPAVSKKAAKTAAMPVLENQSAQSADTPAPEKKPRKTAPTETP